MSKIVDPPIPFSETHPEAAAMLAEECQRRGKIIDEAVAEGKPVPKFKEIVFREQKTVKAAPKVGRNDPCPCGSVDGNGKPKKFKKCCG